MLKKDAYIHKISNYKNIIIDYINNNSSLVDESIMLNSKRIYYTAAVLMLIDVIIIFYVNFNISNLPLLTDHWKKPVLLVRFFYLAIMTAAFLISYFSQARKQLTCFKIFWQYFFISLIMAGAIIDSALDQIVTSNITPFILIAVLVGTIFLMRPLVSFLIYTVTFIIYNKVITASCSTCDILLANQINGLLAVVISFLISIIMWQKFALSIKQRRQIENQRNQLQQQAYHDFLTKLPNRRFFDEVIKRERSLIKRHNYESYILLIDIDDFKKINDTYGHCAGDLLLKQLGELLKKNIRESDAVARLGGEEFIILLSRVSLEEAYSAAERFRKLIMEKKFIVADSIINITASLGLAILPEKKYSENYYHLADNALYIAKRDGKNTVKIV